MSRLAGVPRRLDVRQAVRRQESSAPTWWCAAGSVLVAGIVLAGPVLGPLDPGPVSMAVVALAALVVGLVLGWPWFAIGSGVLQVGAVAWAFRLADLRIGTGSVLVALGLWLSFELACTSFETRASVEITAAAARSRLVDHLGLGALGGVVAGVALAVSASGPTGDLLVLQLAGLAVVAGVVVGLLVLSRRPPAR